MNLILSWLPTFLLVFCRISSFFVVAPIFSSKVLPAQFKIIFSLFVSFLVFSAMNVKTGFQFDDLFILLVLREVLVGLLVGFIAYLFFTAVQVAGSFMDLQIGFGISNIIDPISGSSSPVLGNLKFMLASLLFLSMNGHHYLIMGIMDSYSMVPIQNKLFEQIASGSITQSVLFAFAHMFALAFQMAAPVVVSMFLVDVALGILSKTAPQFNLFVVGVPVKILVGLFILIALMPGLVTLFRSLFDTMFEAMDQILKSIPPV